MDCSTVAGDGDVVSRNKCGTELAAIALAWFTVDDFFLRLLKFGLHNHCERLCGWENETTGERDDTIPMRSEV